jgi:5-methyltetrahydrofolate--homocysteine methyltransferase
VIIIGEKINASIPSIREAIINREGGKLLKTATDQAEAGASYIDVNVGTGEGTSVHEIQSMQWLIGLLREKNDYLFCIDSADTNVLKAGLEAAQDKAGLINSVKGTDTSISEILSLSAEFQVPVIGLAMDEKGIPMDVAGRIRACEKIARGAEKHGVPHEYIYFDPLVLPLSTDSAQGMVTLDTIREIKKEFPDAKTVLALSNVSYGLPERSLINVALLHMAMFLSVDAVLLNPLDPAIKAALLSAQVILGKDRHSRRYTRACRQGLILSGARR